MRLTEEKALTWKKDFLCRLRILRIRCKTPRFFAENTSAHRGARRRAEKSA